MVFEDDLLAAIFWEPSYGTCFYCSHMKEQNPAVYEIWMEIKGEMLLDAYNRMLPPYSECVTACVDCTARIRSEKGPDDNMPILVIRRLRW